MTNIFKLTKAEFVKIFKRPSIFIMAIILVVTIFASISIFNPSSRVNYSVEYDNIKTSQGYYENFYDETVINSKAEFDKGYAETDNIIKYYQSLNTNTNLLKDYYNNVIDTMNKLIAETEPVLKDNIRVDLVENLEVFKSAYKSIDSLSDYSFIVDTTLQTITYTSITSKNYYTTDACVALEQFYTYASSYTSYTASELVDIYLNNNYESSLNTVLNNGINFIYTTFKGLIKDFDDLYVGYSTSINYGLGNLTNIKAYRYDLEKVLEIFYNYYLTLVDNDYPIIIVSESTHQSIKQKVEEAQTYLKLTVTDNENLNKHKEVKTNLDKTGIYNFLKNLTSSSNSNSSIKQVHISDKLVNDLLTQQTKVNNNREIILSNIEDKLNDESITNIAKEISNYRLLEMSYDTLINTKILSHITRDYDQSVYTNFYGYDFDTFNKYNANETITLNSYYINNNVYENSYLNNFSFSQDSGYKTNMYDFMYFSMELCTLVIIIFAMMLVCNLITGETESGTIKLLLVRPYRRSKILTAKLLATIFFVITFMLFSSVLTFVGGLFLYSNTSLPVLAIFNATTAFEIQPAMLMLINVITLTFDVIFFVLIALMISVLFKNFAASISCSLVVLIINFAFNILFGGTFWYTLLPGMNLHLFKYFGNTFISTASANPIASTIQSLLITGIETSMNFWFSILFLAIYSVVSIAVSYAVFQKRDF